MVKRDKAYTLIELLVSITIVLVLTVVGVASYASVGKNARDARRKSDLEKIRVAMEMRKQEKGSYPDTIGGEADSLVSEGYIDTEPIDPRGFKYLYWADGEVAGGYRTYTISASMEVDNNGTKAKGADNCIGCYPDLASLKAEGASCGCVCSSCSPINIDNCSIKGCNYEVKNP